MIVTNIPHYLAMIVTNIPHYIVIVSVVTIHAVTAQDCSPQFDAAQYSGHVVFDETDGSPKLQGQSSGDGIRLLVGCSPDADPSNLAWTFDPPSVGTNFLLQDELRAVGKKMIVLSPEYNLLTNMDISFTMQACNPTSTTDCASATVTVTYHYNANDPSFNHLLAEANIDDADACDANGQAGQAACQVKFKDEFYGFDADSDVLEYSILPVTDNSNLFDIPDKSSLAIVYLGYGVSQETDIILLVQAQEKRTLDSRSSVAVVKVKVQTSISTSTSPPDVVTDCDDKNEKLYFYIMIGLASALGALLLLLLCIPICLKCCRSSSLSISKSRKATVKNSAVFTAGASYKSFSEMNYITLQDSPPSYSTSPELGSKAETNASGRVRSRPKSSKRNLPSNTDSWDQQGESSDSTASVQDRRRDVDV